MFTPVSKHISVTRVILKLFIIKNLQICCALFEVIVVIFQASATWGGFLRQYRTNQEVRNIEPKRQSGPESVIDFICFRTDKLLSWANLNSLPSKFCHAHFLPYCLSVAAFILQLRIELLNREHATHNPQHIYSLAFHTEHF